MQISLSTKKTTDEKHISDSNISNDFLNSDNCNNQYNNGTQLLQNMAMKNIFLPTNTNNIHQNLTNNNTWQLFSVTLQRVFFIIFLLMCLICKIFFVILHLFLLFYR